MSVVALSLLLAAILDLIFGDPVYPYHPVRIIGKIIRFFEKLLRNIGFSGIFGGILLCIVVISITILGVFFIDILLTTIHPVIGQIWKIFLIYSAISLNDLIIHAKRVSKALRKGDLDSARLSVQLMVGRDANLLDSSGVARAAIESTAENFVDGYLSPLFWYTFAYLLAYWFEFSLLDGAVFGIVFFKVVSTMDSMVGYRNSDYLFFGRAAARLDDLLNFIPARISIFIMLLSAFLLRKNPFSALKVSFRDRLKHCSPNAGHAESFMAGALKIRLGGPTRYPFGLIEKPWLGDGTISAEYFHIDQACDLVLTSGIVSLIINILIF